MYSYWYRTWKLHNHVYIFKSNWHPSIKLDNNNNYSQSFYDDVQEIFNHLWWSVSDIYQNLLNGFSLENNRRLNRRTHTYSHMHFVFWLLKKICIKNRYILSIYQTFFFFFWANHILFLEISRSFFWWWYEAIIFVQLTETIDGNCLQLFLEKFWRNRHEFPVNGTQF